MQGKATGHIRRDWVRLVENKNVRMQGYMDTGWNKSENRGAKHGKFTKLGFEKTDGECKILFHLKVGFTIKIRSELIRIVNMQGLSPRNLKSMRAFAAAWPDKTIVQRVVGQIPWRSNIALLDKLNSPRERLWYAQKTVENGWSQPVLAFQIESCLYDRQGKTILV
jgi:hypothetical protein